MKKLTLAIVVVLACVLPLVAGMAEESPTLTDVLARVEKLELRVAELEEVVASLQAQQAATVEEGAVEATEPAERAAAEEAEATEAAESAAAEAEAELEEISEAIEAGDLDSAETGLQGLESGKDSLPEELQGRIGEVRRLLDAAKLAKEAKDAFNLP